MSQVGTELHGSAGRIDVHAHYIPAAYREALVAAGLEPPDGWAGYQAASPAWDLEMALGVMDRLGVATAMLSISTPGVSFGDAASTRRLARTVNEVAAEAMRDHPARFGGFASLPLPDVDAALAEIEYALDTLGLDGVVLLTNYRNGEVYLGDARLAPVFDELNRRSAVAFLHPTSPVCADHVSLGYPRPMIEFPFETTRVVTQLILSNTLERCPNIRLIVPHAGGTLPFLADRITSISARFPGAERRDSGGTMAYLRRLYYDVALSTTPGPLASLLQLVDSTRILYGTDWPWSPESRAQVLTDAFDQSPLLQPDDRDRICRQNALALFPRLRQVADQ